jgi:hypothetical protein
VQFLALPLQFVGALLMPAFITPRCQSNCIVKYCLSSLLTVALCTLQGTTRRVHLVDIPGHPRIRSVFRERCRDAAAVVFVLDSGDFVRQKEETAG